MSVRGGSGGGGGAKVTGSGNSYFLEYAPTALYVAKAFGFPASKITVANDATTANDVNVSYDGATSDGVLKYGETKDFYTTGRTSVYIKSAAGGTNIRLWAE
jgi:hypothetical protein